jgi:uncharacterized membrane protein YhdT
MSAAFGIMLWPFLACLLLPGILVHMGLHIVRREIIFVDLALACPSGGVWNLRGDPTGP